MNDPKSYLYFFPKFFVGTFKQVESEISNNQVYQKAVESCFGKKWILNFWLNFEFIFNGVSSSKNHMLQLALE